MSLSFSNAKTSYTSTSSLIYPIGFTYENQSEVKVRTQLTSGAYQELTNWSFLGTTNIQFSSTPPATFEIYRATDISRSYGTPGYAVFRAGSQLNAGDLNKNFELLRRGIEENNAALSGLLFEDNHYFDETYVNVAGDKMTGNLVLGTTSSDNTTLSTDGSAAFSSKITTAATASSDSSTTVTTKGYVDSSVAAVPGTDLAYDSATRVVSSSTGTDATLPEVAAGGASGLLTGADKTKLDGIASGAQVNVATDLTYTSSSRLLESSTGTDVTLPEVTAAGDSGLMTGADKTKLDGIASGAQVNVATDLAYTSSSRVISSSTGTDATLPEVVAAGDSGLMTGTDKTKLDGIASGAQVNVATDLTYTASTRLLESSTGTDVTLPEVAAAGDSGLMTGADKTKLDGIETGATADQTASELLTAIKTVDGTGSGLDSDLLDGQEGSYYLNYNNLTNAPSSGLWTSSGSDIYFTGGDVGIGTSSPGNPLHIAAQYPTIRFQSNSGSYQGRNTIGQYDNIFYIECDNDNVISSSATVFTIDATERMRLDSSGNLGIGTSSPVAKLDVRGRIYTGDQIGINTTSPNNKIHAHASGANPAYFQSTNDSSGSASNNGIVIGLGSASDAYYWNYAAGAQIWATSGTERMRINSSGNVGIGTTSPNHRLTLHNPSTGTFDALNISSGITNANGWQFGIDSAGEAYLWYSASGPMKFATGNVERMRIDSGTGNVGIGTSTPDSKLHITGGAVTIRHANPVTGTGKLAILTDNGSEGTFVYDDEGIVRWGTASDPSTQAGFSEKMRINSSGNVGIGTSNPGDILHCEKSAGAIKVSSSSDSKYAALYAGDSSNDSAVLWQTGSLRFYNTTERMRIDSSGNVGFGTSSPLSRIHVPSPGTIRVGVNSSRYAYLAYDGIYSRGQDMYIWNLEAYNIRFATNNSEAMRLDSSGRLKINGTNGTARLNIYPASGSSNRGEWDHCCLAIGNSTVVGEYSQIGLGYFNQGSYAPSYIGLVSTSGNGYGKGDLTFGTRDVTTDSQPYERMRLTSAGDLLINSTSNWASATLGVQFFGYTKNGIAIKSTYNGNGAYYVVISNHAGTTIGGISASTTTTSFNTSSDYRLKENVVGIDDGIIRVKQLTPKRFNFIANSDATVDGFIAHEAQTVVPEAVTGTKDQVDKNGNPVYQGIDNSKLVPLLTAALQEAIAKIETLEQRLTDAGL